VLAEIDQKCDALAALCRRYGAVRLEVFGSAARGVGFDPKRSDADFLVTFTPAARNDLAAFADLKEGLEKLLGRPVGLVEREVIEGAGISSGAGPFLKKPNRPWLNCRTGTRCFSSICCSQRVMRDSAWICFNVINY
jgi:uncharacterized protein